MIAFYGTGLLGSGFVRALLRRGESVRVWNRTPSRAQTLAQYGALAFDDPAEAARGAKRVHLSLSDDDAVDEVLERARAGFGPGTTLVDHTTTAPTGTLARAKRWSERGFEFLHAPVFMGPQNALESTGMMLVSGDAALVEQLRPALAQMTGRLLELGPTPERAASIKLLGNLFLMFMTSGCADMLGLGKALGVTGPEVAALFEHFNPGAMIGARMKRILDDDFGNASWELSMARKDARLMLEEAQSHGVTLAVLPAIAKTMDDFLARGHAKDDWTVIASDALPRKAGT